MSHGKSFVDYYGHYYNEGSDLTLKADEEVKKILFERQAADEALVNAGCSNLSPIESSPNDSNPYSASSQYMVFPPLPPLPTIPEEGLSPPRNVISNVQETPASSISHILDQSQSAWIQKVKPSEVGQTNNNREEFFVY